jgi:hypothetical protein
MILYYKNCCISTLNKSNDIFNLKCNIANIDPIIFCFVANADRIIICFVANVDPIICFVANADPIPLLEDPDLWIDRLFCNVAHLKQLCLESYGKEGPTVKAASSSSPELSPSEDDILDEGLGCSDEDPYGVFDLTDTMIIETDTVIIEEEFEEPYTEVFNIQKIYSGNLHCQPEIVL